MLMLCVSLASCSGPTTLNSVAPPGPGLSLHSGEALAVIGVKQAGGQPGDADKEGFQDRRIGFGLNTLLAESFFDAGKFRLVEEKDVRKREFLDDLVQAYWIDQRPDYSEHELARVAAQLSAELLAYGNVSYSRFTGQRIAVGPVSRAEQTLRVQLNVCLYEVATRALLCRQGQGEGRQQGTGMVYEFRGDRLDFEQNAAGRATRQAVAAAVQDLTASIRFSQ
jgi:hypothetical protein